MKNIKVGDYVNGHLVEDVIKIGDEVHYLVTFFMCDIRKPQTLMLPQSKIHSIVKQEDFQRVAHNV